MASRTSRFPSLQPSYQPTDPIISSNFSPLSPSVSRARSSLVLPPTTSPNAGPSTTTMLTASRSRGSERELLLGSSDALRYGSTQIKKPFYRPRPMWLVPFAVVGSIVRGMTLAPRVQVFTQLSCNAIYGHDLYNHTNLSHSHPPKVDFHHHDQPLPPLSSPNNPHSELDILSTIASYIYSPPDFTFASRPQTTSSPSTQDEEEEGVDPRSVPSKRCLSDPAVQAGAAKIQTIMTTTMGVLSALTTGWWGHFGERHGRTRVLAISTVGLFLTDLTFILVSTPHSIFAAHGHKLLIISPFIEGLLGGWSTLQGATSAYVSDCTSDGSRAQIFSRFAGVFYLGFSLGPAVGAYLIRHPIFLDHSGGGGTNVHNGVPMVTSVFYVAALCSFVNLLLVLFVFPESLDKKTKAQGLFHREEGFEEGDGSSSEHGVIARFFGPLKLFLPKKIEFPEGSYHWDWSLTILAIALFGYLLSTGIFQLKYLYAEHIYGWGAEQLSYYISFVGALRAVHLLLFMPLLISTFKPKPKPKSATHSTTPNTSLVTRSSPLTIPTHTSLPALPSLTKKPKPTAQHLAKEMSFDLLVLRLSLVIDLISHTLISILPSSSAQGVFVGVTSLSGFGAGAVPAVNSFALCVVQMREFGNGSGSGDGFGAGRVFGALALIQAVGQQILGPMIFGVIYSTSVAKFPKAIFTTAACILFVSIISLAFVRPGASLKARRQYRKKVRQREEEEVGVERGRSRVSKDLGVGGMSGRGYGVYSVQVSSSEGSEGV